MTYLPDKNLIAPGDPSLGVVADLIMIAMEAGHLIYIKLPYKAAHQGQQQWGNSAMVGHDQSFQRESRAGRFRPGCRNHRSLRHGAV
jgi:hypothetical protein